MSEALGRALRSARTGKSIKVKDVAAACGVQGPAVTQWEKGETEPTFANLKKAADFLKIDVDELLPLATGRALEGTSFTRPRVSEVEADTFKAAPEAPVFEKIRGYAMDIGVYGTAVGGEDADFRLNGQEVDRALRPPGLLNAKGIFALRVENHSMYPAWPDSTLVYINPNRRPKVDDDVIIELFPEEHGDPGRAYLKRLVATTQTKYIVKQFNPPKEIEFEIKNVRQILRVVPVGEMLGFS